MDRAHSATLVTCVKNEASYLLEWLAFHRVCGFDTIVIYDNQSTDGTRALLEPLAARGEVEYRFRPDVPKLSPQIAAFRDSIERCGTEWIAFLDADEFLLLHRHRCVRELLASFEPDVTQVCINWRLFGSSGQAVRKDGMVIERFTMASTPNERRNAHVKSFTRTGCVQAPHIHAPHITGGRSVHADGSQRWMKVQGLTDRITHDVASIHHYVVKSQAEFQEKISRGRGDYPVGHPQKTRDKPDAFFAAHDTNAVPNVDALARIDEVRAELLRLSAIAGFDGTDAPTGSRDDGVRPLDARTTGLSLSRAIKEKSAGGFNAGCVMSGFSNDGPECRPVPPSPALLLMPNRNRFARYEAGLRFTSPRDSASSK